MVIGMCLITEFAMKLNSLLIEKGSDYMTQPGFDFDEPREEIEEMMMVLDEWEGVA